MHARAGAHRLHRNTCTQSNAPPVDTFFERREAVSEAWQAGAGANMNTRAQSALRVLVLAAVFEILQLALALPQTWGPKAPASLQWCA